MKRRINLNYILSVSALVLLGVTSCKKPLPPVTPPVQIEVVDTVIKAEVTPLPPVEAPKPEVVVETPPPAPVAPAPVTPPAPVYVATKVSKAATLFNQSYFGSSVRFWSTKEDKAYTIADLVQKSTDKQAVVDIAYVTRANAEHKLVAPSSKDANDLYSAIALPKQWISEKHSIHLFTKKRVTLFAATNITVDEINAVKDGNYDILIQKAQKETGEPSADNVAISDVSKAILFKNEDGKYGLIVVKKATGTIKDNSATAGKVEFVAYSQAY